MLLANTILFYYELQQPWSKSALWKSLSYDCSNSELLFICIRHEQKWGKREIWWAAKSGIQHSGRACCVHSPSGFWLYFNFAFFLKPLSHKVHSVRSACATSSRSKWSFTPPVELQVLFHSKLLNHRDAAFQFLFHFRGVRVLWRYQFCLCPSHAWRGNHPGSLLLLPKEFKVQNLRLNASIDLGYPTWESCRVS